MSKVLFNLAAFILVMMALYLTAYAHDRDTIRNCRKNGQTTLWTGDTIYCYPRAEYPNFTCK